MQRIGAFYREKVLSQKKLKKREFPYCGNVELIIENDLFSVNLHAGKHLIECRSEEEARFLRVFLDAGMTEISIPQDDEYLKDILPELEILKERTDEIINDYTCYILSRSTRCAVKRRVYQEITQ